MTTFIIGAGMAGLLAANFMKSSTLVLEKAASLPNNHHAVLRFRSHEISDLLEIPFRRVQMIRSSLGWRNPVADSLAYAYKNSGTYRSDRSITDGISVATRYIAPPNFIEHMASRVHIRYDMDFDFNIAASDDPVISTIPMPVLMDKLGYPNKPKFEYRGGSVIRALIHDTDAYATLLFPDPSVEFSRASITGNELIMEFSGLVKSFDAVRYVYEAVEAFGIPTKSVYEIDDIKEQKYFKIQPIDDGERKRFITWASQKHKVYSLGRYATWRPGLLLDDLVNDIRLIKRWIKTGGEYDATKHRGE